MKLELSRVLLKSGGFRLEIDTVLVGEVIAFFGPSGSGKTSLLELIAGLRRAESARIVIDDILFTDTDAGFELPTRDRQIGYVPQDAVLFPHLNVRGNLLAGSRRATETPLFSPEHVAEVLGITRLFEKNVREISGGEKQRVALARALLSQPKLLLLDEPFGALDQSLRSTGLELLEKVRSEFQLPIIYISHSAEEVVRLCDRVIVLKDGRPVRQGRPEEVFVRETVSVLSVGASNPTQM